MSLPTATVTATSPRAEIEAAYADINGDLDAVVAAEYEARDAFMADRGNPIDGLPLQTLETVRALRAYLSAEFDRLWAIMAELPEIEAAPASDAADQLAFAL